MKSSKTFGKVTPILQSDPILSPNLGREICILISVSGDLGAAFKKVAESIIRTVIFLFVSQSSLFFKKKKQESS